MKCMNCGIDISNAVNIRVFENGAVKLCDTHYKVILKENTNNYSPLRFRKQLTHPLKEVKV